MSKPITPNLEPASARRFIDQLQMLDGELLQALVDRAARWKTDAERKHEDLIRRAGAGANNLKRAVKAWDEALPALHRAMEAARARLGATTPKPSPTAEVAPATEPNVAVEHAAAAAGGKQPAATAEPSATGISGLDAAAQVLREAREPLDTPEMVKRMLERGLWFTKGKTPAATIYAAIIREIRTKGSEARFRKTARGRFEVVA